MSLKNNTLILLPLLIAACKQMPEISVPTLPGLGPHKIEIQQGNVVTQEMLDKLQPGMTRSQVRFVLGTPLLVDPFRTDRWDYVYTMNKKGERVEQRQLKVFFQDEKMLRYEGDIVAETKPAVDPVAAVKPAAEPAVAPVAPVAKPEPREAAVVAPVVPMPAPQLERTKPVVPAAPSREAAAEIGKPQLQMAPGPGEPAKPEDLKPAAPVVAIPSRPESLDAPPLPRLILPPEPAEAVEPAHPIASMPDTLAKPTVAPVAAKPETRPAEKPPAGPGFFGRWFGGSQKPAEPSVAAKPLAPARTEAPSAPAPAVPPPLEKPGLAISVEKPAEKPVMAKPEVKPAEKPPAGPGFFGRLFSAAPSKAAATRYFPGGEREAAPGSAPAPFVDPDPVPPPAKP